MGSKEKTKVSRKAQLKDKNVGRAVSSALLGRLCKSGPSKPRTSLNMSHYWAGNGNKPSLPKLLLLMVLLRALEILTKTAWLQGR